MSRTRTKAERCKSELIAGSEVLLNAIIENTRIYQGITNYFSNRKHYLVSILVLCHLQMTVSILIVILFHFIVFIDKGWDYFT